MPDIVLATLNARWSHCSFALRYLRANLGPLRERSVIREFTISERPEAIVERLLADQPRVIGLGVYIWNLAETAAVVRLLKAVAPEIQVVVGGPEVSYESADEPVVRAADVLITGEADLAFARVCGDLLSGIPVPRLVAAGKVAGADLVLPYGEYSDEDLARRIVYVEASRGCPFTCEFCLSSVDNGVRNIPQAHFLAAMEDLLRRGNRTFKFVDRTFNLSPTTAAAILRFFLDRWRDGLFLHFELVPDRLPDVVKDLLPRFPAGAVQFEIGIQSFTPEVGANISRRMDAQRTEDNLRWLHQHTGIHLHTDLIIGLPGETLETFRESFDRLWHLGPHEIQVGILKRLKGTPIARHAQAHGMRFNPDPAYDLLASTAFPFPLMQRLKRLARYFDLFVNHGHFPRAIAALVAQAPTESPFLALLAFSDWLWAETAQDHALARTRLVDLLLRHLVHLGQPEADAIELVAADAAASGEVTGLPNRLHAAVERHRRARAQVQISD